MNRNGYTGLLVLLASMWCHWLAAGAQPAAERMVAFTDKDCYVAGERLQLSLRTLSADGQLQGLSRVAYAELADTTGMVLQTMVELTDGIGWAQLALPPTLHSGNYQLTTYTRHMRNYGQECFFRKIVSVVNVLHTSARDRLLILPPEPTEAEPLPRRRYKAGQRVHVSLPADSAMQIATLALLQDNLPTADYSLPAPAVPQHSSGKFVAEAEGHQVMATPSRGTGEPAESRLVMVGQGIMVSEGRPGPDSTRTYFTTGISGSLPTLLNGYDSQGLPAPMQFASPYAQVVPAHLPDLQVWATAETLCRRSLTAQREEALARLAPPDTMAHSVDFLSVRPDYFYDLDEYTRFNTVSEILTEFVVGVSRRRTAGRTCLYIRHGETTSSNSWPALVLLDGMPIYDIDALLRYDARLLRYVQIYAGAYSFGQTVCQGVISFISRRGRLSNFKLDEGSLLVRYDFPQRRPPFVLPQGERPGTVVWEPCVEGRTVEFDAPANPGRYELILQGTDTRGCPFRSASEIVVE